MSTNEIYVKTAKTESEVDTLSIDFTRILALIDGKSTSDELAKRAPPSLRKQWGELINQLLKGGYIVSNPIDRNITPHKFDSNNSTAPKNVVLPSANDLDYRNMPKAARVVVEPEAVTTAAKAISAVETKAEAESKQNTEKAARAAELKAFFATAKEKAKAEAKKMEQEAALARTNQEAAAVIKARSAAEAKAKADALQRAQESARALAELEAAITAAKVQSEFKAKAKSEHDAEAGVNSIDDHRLLDLKIENESLKKLLAEAYLEISAIKTAKKIKP